MKYFDNWVVRGPFRSADLGVYRIIFGLAALALLPNAQFLAGYPSSFFAPPPGPLQRLSGIPPLGVLISLEIALALALAAVVFGVFTRTASVVAGVLMVLTFGLTYSFGKIDHTIFLPLAALLVVWAGWGRSYSIDSLKTRADPDAPVSQWPLRLFALLIGVGFATAAIPKFLGGWLKPGTQATEGHYWYETLIDDRNQAFAPLFGHITSPIFWEPLDWVTVALEGGIILSVISWRSFRIMIALASVFHVGVLVMMNILFTTNVVAYAAFVPWGLVLVWLKRRGVHAPRLSARAWTVVAAVGIPVLAIVAWALAVGLPIEARDGIKIVIIVIAGIVSACYLVFEILNLVRWIRGRSARRDSLRRREVAHAR
ncbi:hypothetical protein B7R21_03705 [Subtercola boreus]|uniref:HTTM domain-containing protein n=1 Tax=Subtercola boreus TaxID=120213 RepID=A0A3E0W0Q0_9MICO|nr:HTTM domain-containing protein [Subtercola boreus]RFA15148.1 hypothetical protein B7R21_03705 [Subtercola boreus]